MLWLIVKWWFLLSIVSIVALAAILKWSCGEDEDETWEDE